VYRDIDFTYPLADAHIERNIFYQSGGISGWYDNDVSIYIKNNVFAEQSTPSAVENRLSYNGATVVENNSFFSTDRVALSLPSGNVAAISAANNYFGTTDSALIDAMIHDQKDDLYGNSIISASHTNAPSPDTPRFFIGADDNDILAGGGTENGLLIGKSGIDTVVYAHMSDQYKINIGLPDFLGTDIPDVAVSDTSPNTGVDVLIGVERLRFSDKSIALDIDGNAGKVAKILGAVFGKEAVSNAEDASIGLQLLDDGMSYEDLMMLALNTKLGAGFSNTDEVKLLYQNLVGSQPSQTDIDYWTETIASGQYTQATLGIMAAELELNVANINLSGLAKTGLVYNN
jgi:hypothetical protein